MKNVERLFSELSSSDWLTIVCLVILALIFIIWLFIRPSYDKKVINNRFGLLKKATSGNKAVFDDDFKSWLSQYFVVDYLTKDEVSFLKRSANNRALLKVPAEDVVSSTAPYHGESNMPSIMTTIGVLGTFAGITLGIQPLDIGFSQGSEELLQGAGVLIEGMKTAFVTSLAGLILATISMLLLSLRQLSYNKDSATWISELKERAVLADPFTPLMALASPERHQADKQAILASESMLKAATAMQQSLSGFNADAIGDRVASSIEVVLQGNMMPVFSNMESSLSSIQERMQNQNEEVLESLIANLRTEVIEPLAIRVEDSVKVSAEVAQAVNSLNEDLSGLEDAMSNTVKRFVKAGEELIDQSTRMLESKNHIQELLEAVGATKATMMNQLDEAAKHLGSSVSGLYQKYEQLDDTIKEQITSIMQQHEAYLSEAEKRHQRLFEEHDKYTTDILEHVEGATNRIAAVADDIHDNVKAIQPKG